MPSAVLAADLGDLVGEPGPLEVAGVGVDDGVGEEVAAGVVDAVLSLAHADVDVGVDRRRLAASAPANLLDRPRHVRGGQVVEQHAVGDLAGELQHAWLSAPITILGLRSPSRTPSRKRLHVVEVALERDRLAAERHCRTSVDVLADLGQRAVAERARRATWLVTTGDEMPMPRRMSRSGCSACSVAAGHRRRAAGCAAAGPAHRCPGRARARSRPRRRSVENASGPVVSAVQKDR